MPIAAIPEYLGTDFQHASPGMRFGMYLKLWGIDHRSKSRLWQTHDVRYEVRGQQQQEREVKDENKVFALSEAKRLNANDQQAMKALLARQQQIFNTSAAKSASVRLYALATAPFTTGLGNEHPLENGFAFLNPYGLPYLPGSGVKGVLRQAARELASGDWGETGGWSGAKTITLMQGESDKRRTALDKARQPVMLSQLDVLFGRETVGGDADHVRGALSFWDVIPQIKGDSLAVDIMTPHQGHYYQQKSEGKSGGSTTPHDSGAPIPISFLTVPPGSGFVFHVQCNLAHLARLAPELVQGERWKTLLEAAFAHAFQWLGFGAKTAVGYGAMSIDSEAADKAASLQAERQAEAARLHEAAEQQARRNSMTPATRAVEDFIDTMRQRHAALRGTLVNPNGTEHSHARQLATQAHAAEDWSAAEKRAAAEAISEWLPKVVRVDIKDERKKLKLAALRGEA